MALNVDAIGNEDFACKVIENQSSPGGGKTMNAVARYGVSRDSPFKNEFTTDHPSTKQLLDYNDGKRPVMTADQRARISKLPIDQQIAAYSKHKIYNNPHPKMFTNIMRQGMSKDKQMEFDNYYNTALRHRAKLQLIDVQNVVQPYRN